MSFANGHSCTGVLLGVIEREEKEIEEAELDDSRKNVVPLRASFQPPLEHTPLPLTIKDHSVLATSIMKSDPSNKRELNNVEHTDPRKQRRFM